MELANPAPGRLELVRAFINTLDVEEHSETLTTPSDLSGWLIDHQLLEPTEPVRQRDLELAIELREALRHLAYANHGDAERERALAQFDDCCRDLHLHLRVKVGGSERPLSLEPDEPGVRSALGKLLVIVFESMFEGTWPRLKACANETCQWAFYDLSRNRSGRWCDMSSCGNVIKVRNYRRRAAAG